MKANINKFALTLNLSIGARVLNVSAFKHSAKFKTELFSPTNLGILQYSQVRARKVRAVARKKLMTEAMSTEDL